MNTVNEVAEFFKVMPITVFRWIADGKIKATKIGKEWRISKEEVEFVKNNGLRKGE